MDGIPIFIGLLIVLVLLYQSVWILNEYERGVVFRLGRFQSVKEVGARQITRMSDQSTLTLFPKDFWAAIGILRGPPTASRVMSGGTVKLSLSGR